MVAFMAESYRAAIEHYSGQLRSVFEGRKIVLIGGPVAALTQRARELRSLGADRPFIIGSSLGTGELPSEDDAVWVSLELRAGSITDAIRAYENQLTHLPEEVRQRLDAYDPKRSAIAVGAIVLGDVPQVGGRPRYGARPRSWAALEDKVTVDALWDSLEIERAPCQIVRPVMAALEEAVRLMDKGAGTVWAGDAREGVHGGAEGLRWVRDEEQAREAADFFATRCDRVRVTPFLEGVPCSIHGMVLSDGVAVFRPVEMVTLRRSRSSRLLYAGAATFWDPPPEHRDAMREVARRTGHALAERVGFRGTFTVDGVLTERGFRPTELNPRIGAGLSLLEASTQGLPLVLLALAAQAGQNLDYRPDELEEFIVTAADARRGGGAWVAVPKSISSTSVYSLVEEQRGYRLARDGETKHAELVVGPSDLGGFLRFNPDPVRIAPGSSIAPRVVSVFDLADRELGLTFGPLEHAKPVR
jgi:hypothetical protein